MSLFNNGTPRTETAGPSVRSTGPVVQESNPLTSNSFPSYDKDAARRDAATTPPFSAQPTQGRDITSQRTPVEEAYHGASDVVGDVVGRAETPGNTRLNETVRPIEGVCSDPKVAVVNKDIKNFQVELREPLVCNLVINNKNVTITIPKGFRTDLASIPRGLSKFLPPWGDYATAAIIHDYLYEHAPHGVTRFQSDMVFYDCMKRAGVNFGMRCLLTGAVMLMGGAPWRRFRQAEAQTRYAMA